MRYIGSKVNLLSEISAMVGRQAPDSKTFCDLFAGTGVVGRNFKSSHQIISNDILYFSFVLNAAYIGLSSTPDFSRITNVLGENPIDFLNLISVRDADITESDFIAISYSPAGEARRQYLTTYNAVKIDRIRQTMSHWLAAGHIDEGEFYYLLACLIEKVPTVSNTTGTYGAFLKNWDNRALKPLTLSHLEIVESSFDNKVFNQDSNDLIRQISGDFLYLDTPYNGRQYSSNYHLLETLARYDQPELKGITGTRVDGSGESKYCRKDSVFQTFDDLLDNSDFRTILISYSSDGILSEEKLTELMIKHGNERTLIKKKLPYRRYKRTANDDRNVLEFLFAISR